MAITMEKRLEEVRAAVGAVEKNITVALIEDHNLTRMGLKAAFRQAGLLFVGEATNGKTGLTMLSEQQPDVAVVDVGLPDIDGSEVVQTFRERHPESQTRILMLTMHDMSRLAAALAYYTTFSLAPVLIIVIAVASFLFEQSAV